MNYFSFFKSTFILPEDHTMEKVPNTIAKSAESFLFSNINFFPKNCENWAFLTFALITLEPIIVEIGYGYHWNCIERQIH